MKTLILGGVRSGKSKLAEQLAKQSALPVTYIATATAIDKEMQLRIEQHQVYRPSAWTLIEEPVYLATAIQNHATKENCLIIDCLTLWLTNLLLLNDNDLLNKEKKSLLQQLPFYPGRIIFVGNETNMGIIPMDKLSRRYCDEAGKLHQKLAQICDQVILTVAGLPYYLKGGCYE